jgi:hypothetical protein
MNSAGPEIEVVVPDDAAAAEFRRRIEREGYHEAHARTVVLADLAWGYCQPAHWQVLPPRRAEDRR